MQSISLTQRAAVTWLAVCALATVFAAANAQAADLTVNIKGARSAQGSVLVALYDSAATFLKPGAQISAQMGPATTSDSTVVFRNLPAGRYALTAFHDENANGKLDFNIVGSPMEAVGFSNDAFGIAAPPVFDKAAVDFTTDTAITINLR